MDKNIIIKVIIKKPSEKVVQEEYNSWNNKRKTKPTLWVNKETLKYANK